MVTRLPLEEKLLVRVQPREWKWSHGVAVNTRPCQGRIRGSIPLGTVGFNMHTLSLLVGIGIGWILSVVSNVVADIISAKLLSRWKK